jgi:hypothetical protein
VIAGNEPVLVHNCGDDVNRVSPEDVVRHIRTSGNPARVVVIGRTMDRVRAATRELQRLGLPRTRWSQAWNKGATRNIDDRNETWIQQKVKDGYEIIYIGPDSTRTDGPIGNNYGMERRETDGYGRMHFMNRIPS